MDLNQARREVAAFTAADLPKRTRKPHKRPYRWLHTMTPTRRLMLIGLRDGNASPQLVPLRPGYTNCMVQMVHLGWCRELEHDRGMLRRFALTDAGTAVLLKHLRTYG